MINRRGTSLIMVSMTVVTLTILAGALAVGSDARNKMAIKQIHSIKTECLAHSIADCYASIMVNNIPANSTQSKPEVLTPMKFLNVSGNGDSTEAVRLVEADRIKIVCNTTMGESIKTITNEYYSTKALQKAYGLEYGTFKDSKLPKIKAGR